MYMSLLCVVECHKACEGCTDAGTDHCLQCAPGFYSDNNTCKGSSSITWAFVGSIHLIIDLLFAACHASCSGGCYDETTLSCDSCKDGWLWDALKGCQGTLILLCHLIVVMTCYRKLHCKRPLGEPSRFTAKLLCFCGAFLQGLLQYVLLQMLMSARRTSVKPTSTASTRKAHLSAKVTNWVQCCHGRSLFHSCASKVAVIIIRLVFRRLPRVLRRL